jgi:hypothetical protein
MEDIVKTRNAAQRGLHFYLVDGPSGIGKTQLPFAFRAVGIPLFHLLMRVDSVRPQEVYQPLAISSNIFCDALANDVRRHFGDTKLLDAEKLLANRFELDTVGVIFALLGVPFDHIKSWHVLSLAQFVERFKHKEQLPIFFLDEVLPHFDHREGGSRPVSSELRLARNLLRAVGLVPVLMGTNSSAANFISAASSSRGGEAHPWCKLVTRLPSPNEESLEVIGATRVINTLHDLPSLSSIAPFLFQQFSSCTPWFIELFVKVVQEFLNLALSATEFLDRVLCEMAKRVFEGKGAFHRQSFRRAQFCYHLKRMRKPHRLVGECSDSSSSSSLPHENTDCSHEPAVAAYRSEENEFGEDQEEEEVAIIPPEKNIASREDRTLFVASHFASLDDEDCDLFIHRNCLSKNQKTEWRPTASFKGAEDDSFLYLMLGDGNRHLDFPAPFVSFDSKRMTTLETFKNLMDDHNGKSSGTVVPTENDLAMKREGNELEATAAVAVEIASHRGGLGGLEIPDFLLQLATELLSSYERLEWSYSPPFPVTPATCPPLNIPLSERRVPYLSSEGDSWPQTFREIDGVCWGHLSRTKDREKIDLKILTAQSPTQPVISAECKNYANNLSGEVLRGILRRIPGTSWLHLVLCTHMQDAYWTEATEVAWEPFRAKHGLGESAILRVVKQGSRLTLEPLFPKSVPLTPPTKLVVFFPFEDWILKKKKRKSSTEA